MKISFSLSKDVQSITAQAKNELDLLVYLVDAASSWEDVFPSLKTALPGLEKVCAGADFKGKKDSYLSYVPLSDDAAAAKRIVFLITDSQELLGFEKAGGQLLSSVILPHERALAIDDAYLASATKEKWRHKGVTHVALGLSLANYRFHKYKTKTSSSSTSGAAEEKDETTHGNASCTRALEMLELRTQEADLKALQADWPVYEAIYESVNWTRDLVNEPANVLYPEAFAERACEMAQAFEGLKVTVLNVEQMQKLGMQALLAVGQGSAHESRLVVLEWKGDSSQAEEGPVLLVGKGVCFDSGGISLKPSKGMESMKGDMAGAACVAGAMRLLAARKAKAHVVGILGLVENMPSGTAQRPGDVVTAMSGTTIEVLNTDAEGRMVLADAIWYGKETFKPRLIVDLATLTGAIVVALGSHYAGLFSNNDQVCEHITSAGLQEGEKVWRLPMHEVYKKMVLSKVADIQNIGSGGGAGSITAAEFLQFFVGDTPWAHIDIAGTAIDAPQTATNKSWGSGYGVRLLNALVKNHYEHA